jgi:hypothetical protein
MFKPKLYKSMGAAESSLDSNAFLLTYYWRRRDVCFYPSVTDEARPAKGRGRNFTAEECFILSRAWIQQSRTVDEQNDATFWPGVLVAFEKGGGTVGRTSTSLRNKLMEFQMQVQK